MKRYKLKQWVKDLLFATIIGLAFFEGLSLIAYSAKEYNNRILEEETQKKTDTSRTYISQN